MENKSYILKNVKKNRLQEKLRIENSRKMMVLNNGGFDRLKIIRENNEIHDEVKILTMLKDDFSELVMRTIDDYISNFEKMSDKYGLQLVKPLKHSDYIHKVKWVKKVHSHIDIFPPTLRKMSIDIISNAPEIITSTVEELKSTNVVGYFRESNLMEDFLLCSSSKNWNSCAAFAHADLGMNSGFIYGQSKYDKIVYLFNTEEEAILGIGDAEARFIVSHIDGEIITHRVYSSVKYEKEEIKRSYLSNYLNDNMYIDNDKTYRISMKKFPNAYPDIAHSSTKISLLNKIKNNNKDKANLIKKEYLKTETSMFFIKLTE